MFEKEAEEIANKRCHEIMCFGHCSFSSPKHHRCGEWHREYNCAKEGIEFGYNKAKEDADKMKSQFLELCNLKDMRIEELEKANEWHYVKDGDLPNTETKDYTYIRRRKRYERHFTDYRVIKCYVLCQNEKGKITAEVGYFDCNKKCFLDKAEGIVIAWKEIVLPELKESE